MKIVNIIYNDELVNHDELSYINYYKSENINIIVDNDLPTLIVGWDIVKSNDIENVSILNNEIIKHKLYWCFSFNENKQKHINDVDYFSEIAIEYYFINKYNYKIIDPIFDNIHTEDELFNIIKYPTVAYNYKNMLYLLNDKDIYILNVDVFKYFSFNIKNIFKYLDYYVSKFIKDDNMLYKYYFHYFNGYNNLKRYIVTLV